MPKVWLKKPDTCSPLSQLSSGAPPPEASGSTELVGVVAGKADVVMPVTFKPCAGIADRSPAIDFPVQSPTIANANPSAAIFFLTPPDESAPCNSVSIQILPA